MNAKSAPVMGHALSLERHTLAANVDSASRILTALHGQQPDRVPLLAMFGLAFLKRFAPHRRVKMLDAWVEDPLNTIIKVQEELGFDPVVYTCSELIGEVFVWPKKLFRWEAEALANWRERVEITDGESGRRMVRRVIATPKGELSLSYCYENCSYWVLEHPLKTETDSALLRYRPDPDLMDVGKLRRMVEIVGGRGVFLHIVPGVWKEACDLRGVNEFLLDVYDRPSWAKELLETITGRLIRVVRRVAATGVQAMIVDESTLGVGISPRMFEEFVYPYDRQVVRAANQAGVSVIYHNCGRSRFLLPGMAATEAQAIETLTPPVLSGDVDLAGAKRDIGSSVCLMGGFNERVLLSENLDEVRREAKRCIDAAATGGGYILRPAGQILDANRQNLDVLADTIQTYGKY